MEKENKTINILLIVIMILVVVGCIVAYLYFTHAWEKKDKNQDPIFTMENYPKIDGSTATLPLAQAYKSAFTGTSIENVDVTHSKTHNAYVNLINKKSDLILVTYPSEEEQQLAKDAGVELEIVPVVKEAFVFFVNKENSIDNLTLNQIQDIYSGKVTNWKEVGGTDAQILAYQRPQNSGSQSGMLSLVMQGIKMRLDKFLKVSRVIKRRTVANDAADMGRVSVNGKVVKPSYEVKEGDIVEIKFGDKVSKFQILKVPKVAGKDMGELIKIL